MSGGLEQSVSTTSGWAIEGGPPAQRADTALSLAAFTAIATARAADRLAGIELSTQAVAYAMGGIAETLDEYLPQILTTLETASASLSDIEQLLRRPEGAAADEHLRRAEDLFGRGLVPEAEQEFRESLKHEPYEPVTRYRLGQIARLQGRHETGGASFRLAQRYSKWRPLTASATLMSANCFGPEDQRRRDVLRAGCEMVDDCPDLLVAASATEGPQALVQAFRLAPDMIEGILATGVRHLEAAAKIILESGELDRAHNTQSVLAEGRLLLSEVKSDTPRVAPVAAPDTSSAETLLWTLRLRREAVDLRRTLIRERDSMVRPQSQARPRKPHSPGPPPGRQHDRGKRQGALKQAGSILLKVLATWLTVGLYGLYWAYTALQGAQARRAREMRLEAETARHQERVQEYEARVATHVQELADYELARKAFEAESARVQSRTQRISSLVARIEALLPQQERSVTRPVFL